MPDQNFCLYQYRTRDFLIALGGLILLGAAALLVIERGLPVSNAVQYGLLTAWIAGAYFAAGRLAAKPAQIAFQGNAILVAQGTRKPEIIPVEAVKSYAFYEELTLFSLKIAMQDGEMLSIIQFKWKDQADFQAFLAQFKALAMEAGDIQPDRTFYRSRFKVLLTIGLLAIYIPASVLLVSCCSFAAWPAVFIYFYWVLPVLFFFKMIKAK